MTAVSVVIPVHNRPDLLRDAIGSTLKQTYTDFEVIVVDDASTEDIHEVVRGFDDGAGAQIERDPDRVESRAEVCARCRHADRKRFTQ